MTEIKLLALDLDGTLFDSQKVVSEENKQALRAARDKGVKVVITTGRPLKAVEDLLDELDLISDEDYIITFNGGLVQKTNGKILDKSQLTRDQLRRLHGALEPLGLPFDVLSDGIVYSLPSQGNHSHYPQANPKLTFVELDSFDEIPKDVIYNKVVSVTDPEFLDKQILQLPKDLYEAFEIFKSREIILEMMPKGVHKAAGLQQLIDHLGFLPEQVMAMGDEENDLSMLKWAGLGVAMANAVPKVKAIANHTTTRTNEESGVAETIEEYILKA
ncbi:Cof-type HAD-IIB family hydrolase [Streptococcus alactolyticus]|uniref:Cof-type HAD-IIB family hydrolase n=1 Tax=Streptococcus alactolyticus TaxID=29389 RepID=A0ABY7LWL6_STRAY|nr:MULTISPECIES: Cof-type HAD-IIB family hydrolase [Streptococcus]MCI6904424.1 Cof-type HAD-IIB family hydrolase [Streptococcus alactolyticus]MDD7361254.1 Cof-type HAD-IIB family hydrolase [Streptococcus alactolyticus]MDY5187503.1 Cof-type HAD-IIB family hydrolase [Streptococcus alactolyticus]WBB05978.1 Cof-type HAD-IIB family hydrolase [Streptococcus alactolyticus]